MANITHAIRLVADAKKAMDDIRQYKDEIVATAQTVKKYEATLNGDQILKAANNWTAAVGRLGGATKDAATSEQLLAGVAKMSASEKERINRALTEAIEKYRLLGQQAPSAMLAVADATRQVKPPTDAADSAVNKMLGGLKTAAGIVGVAFSAQAVIGFGKKVFDTASNIHDMAERLGVSAEAAQGFKFASEQAGSSLDTVGTVISKMNEKLAEGDKSTIGALRDAHLSFQAIRAMRPEDAFLAITDAVQRIPDPMMQSRIAVELLGKSAIELLPAIKEGFRATSDAAAKMSDETVNRLEAAQDAWGKLEDTAIIASGEIVAHTMRLVEHAKKGWGEFFDVVGSLGARVAGHGQLADVMEARGGFNEGAFRKETQAALDAARANREHIASLFKTKEQLEAAEKAAKEHAAALDDVRRAAIPLTDAQRAQAEANEKAGISAETTGKALHVSATAISAYLERVGNAKAVSKLWSDAHDDMARAARKLSSDMLARANAEREAVAHVLTDTQNAQLKAAVDYQEKNRQVALQGTELKLHLIDVEQAAALRALRADQGGLAILDTEQRQYYQHLRDLANGTQDTIVERMRGAGVMTRADLQLVADHAKRDYDQMKASGEYAAAALQAAWQRSVDAQNAATDSLGVHLKRALHAELLKIPQTIADALTGGGGLGGAVKAIASGVGAAIGGNIGMAVGGPMGQAIGSALGSLAGPLIGKIGSLLGIGATEYEKRMRAAAAETTKLQQELVKGHGSMAQLIIDADLVGINIKEAFNWKDPEAFKNVVAELDQKTQLLNSAMQEYGFTWEDLGEKARGAKLAQLFDDLFAKTEVLRTAGIDYHAILEKQAGGYSALVQAAIRTGTEIPAAMQQTLQDLVDMGQLVDENGVAFDDLSDVHWAKTLTQGFDEVTDAIHELTDALTRGVGGALDTLATRTVRIPIHFDADALPSSAGAGGAIPMASGGDFLVTRPTLFLAGEAGRERATFTPAGRSRPSDAGPQQITLVTPDGRTLWSWMLDQARAEGLT